MYKPKQKNDESAEHDPVGRRSVIFIQMSSCFTDQLSEETRACSLFDVNQLSQFSVQCVYLSSLLQTKNGDWGGNMITVSLFTMN